jgi:nitrous oxidase accessory protein NosD
VVIAPPAGGLATNAADDTGRSIAAQLWVDNAPGGPVNISNIIVDGTGNGVANCFPFIVGIFYQNSAGTANRVTARNQKGNGCGVGIWVEGGSALPTVTIENSSVHDVDYLGIYTETNAGTPELTATIKTNDVVSANTALFVDEGSNDTVSANSFTGRFDGIFAFRGAGSVSGNTVNAPHGIYTQSDGVSFTSNRVLNSSIGIIVGTSVAAIQNNSITSSNVGINFTCSANPNVTHNTINDAQTGIDQVPGILSTPNTYFNVATIRTGGC